MTDFAFTSDSDTGSINAVSVATKYYKMVEIDGDVYRLGKGNTLYHEDDPDQLVTTESGTHWTLDDARSGGHDVSEVYSDVSWRTPFGVNLQFPHTPEQFLKALGEASPDVNTIRLDFNAATLDDTASLAKFQSFAAAAADKGCQLIIQYSDGAMSGENTAVEDRVTTDDPSGRMTEIGAEWKEVMEWFEQPENAKILDAVYGWELINEPIAYHDPQAYSEDVVSLYEDHGIDWHDKKILIGGTNASAKFNDIDLDLIRDAIGGDLIWSWHLYPDWGNTKHLDFDQSTLESSLASRIGGILDDNILLTETQFYGHDNDGDGLADFVYPTAEGEAMSSFNFSSGAEWLAENGIGMTYWPPVGRASAYLTNAGKGKFEINIAPAAHANNIWSYDEIGDAHEQGDQSLAAEASSEVFKTPFGQAFGKGGNDTIDGLDDMRNMLYGGDGEDVITGGNQMDFIFGQRGNDNITGGEGNDFLYGGAGQDSIYGDDGNDLIDGGSDADLLSGGDGDDVLIAGGGDEVRAGKGGDTLYVTGEDADQGPVYITEWDKDDRISLENWEGKGRVKFVTEEVEIEGQDPGLRLTIEDNPAFDVVMTADAAKGFLGADSFVGHEHEPEITQYEPAGDAPDHAFDPETGDLTWIGPKPNEEPDTDDQPNDDKTPGKGDDHEDKTADGTDEDPNGGTDTGGANPGVATGTPPPDKSNSLPGEEDEEDVYDDGRYDDDSDDYQDVSTASGGACFVATAAYGDRMHSDVVALRHFRDQHLIKYRLGRTFIRFYWRVGPTMAALTTPASLHGTIARVALARLTRILDCLDLSGRKLPR